MSLINVIIFISSFLILNLGYAVKPPYEILKSCRDGKPDNSSITMTRIDFNARYTENKNNACVQAYTMTFHNHEFSTANCYGKQYLIIQGNKITLSTAIDLLKTPMAKPGNLIPHLSDQWQITSNDKQYLCITGPIAETGEYAAFPQSYILTNVFNHSETMPKLYYYFVKY